MSIVKSIKHSPLMRMPAKMRMIAAFFIAITLAFSVMLVGAAQMHEDAYAAIYPVAERDAQNSDAAADSGASATKAAGTEADKASGESIEDDATPMSSGLSSGEPASSPSGLGIQWIVIGGIVAVVVFFAMSTRRINSNIAKMKGTFK